MKLIWFHEVLSVIFTQVFLMFSIHEDWVSHLKINGSGNGFMENLYDHDFYLFIVWFKEQIGKKKLTLCQVIIINSEE